LKVLRHCLNVAKSEEHLDGMKDHLPAIWFNVHKVLRLGSRPRGSLADEDQFLANVNRLGVEKFCDLVRDAKEENGTWKEFLENGEIPPSPAFALIMTSLDVFFAHKGDTPPPATLVSPDQADQCKHPLRPHTIHCTNMLAFPLSDRFGQYVMKYFLSQLM
jgi:hypothetical protein